MFSAVIAHSPRAAKLVGQERDEEQTAKYAQRFCIMQGNLGGWRISSECVIVVPLACGAVEAAEDIDPFISPHKIERPTSGNRIKAQKDIGGMQLCIRALAPPFCYMVEGSRNRFPVSMSALATIKSPPFKTNFFHFLF